MKTIQVTGTGTANKGAELLLVAIQQQFAAIDTPVRLAVASNFGSYEDRGRYGLRTVLPEHPWGRWWMAGKLMPAAFRQTMGLVAEFEVDAVVDASGFAFGDQLGASRAQKFARDVKRWKKQGKPIVLLPQAFGPFENPEVRAAFQYVANNVDLIFARETVSYDYVSTLVGESPRLQQSPDFTNLVECSPHDDAKPTNHVLIVPNHQMIAKNNAEQARKYIPFLASCYHHLKSIGLNPALLLHDDRMDWQLVQPLKQALDVEFPVFSDKDPVALKAALGRARLVIGSRFHALAGALSQGVPTIAVGWSHKYQMLLADYECIDSVLTVDASKEQIGKLIGKVMSEWDLRNQRALAASERLKQRTREMWESVLSTIGVRQESSLP